MRKSKINKQTAEQREKELQDLVEFRQKTKSVREATYALSVGEKKEFPCPFCGGIVDIERPCETNHKMTCRQCGFMSDSWGY